MIVNEFPGRQISIEGKDYLYFGGTSYLGMATNPDFQELVISGIRQWGTFYGSSRTANVRMAVYDHAETLFSEWIGTESSALVSSGALAGQMVMDQLSKSDRAYFHYPKTHPAILHKDSLPLFVNGGLHPRLTNTVDEEVVISADAIRSLEVYPTTFEFLDDISINKSVTLVVDESHSFGILGKDGRGIFKDISNDNLQRAIMISSIGKALGLSGGVIASDKKFITTIKDEASFVSSSGPNAGYLEAFIKGQRLYESQLQKLKANLRFLFKELDPKFRHIHSSDYPVLYFDQDRFYEELLDKGIVITSFLYPSYEKPMNRIVITAEHQEEDLQFLIAALNETVRQEKG